MSRLSHEMSEQPQVLQRLLTDAKDPVSAFVGALKARAPRAMVFVARGSSDHAATYGRYLFEARNGLLTSSAAPATVTLYDAGPDLRDTCVMGVSQSGQGDDVTAFLRRAREQGALTAAIVNDRHSPLAAAAEFVLDCQAGPEVSIPATKTVTAQMMLLSMVSDELLSGGGSTRATSQSRALLPGIVGEALALEGVAAFAERLARFDDVSILGRGFAYPVALEVALKMKEMVRLHASAYSSADFLHGPVTLAGPEHGVLVLDAGEKSTGAAEDAIRAVEPHGAQALRLQVGRIGDSGAAGALALPCDVEEHHAAIALLLLGQRLSLELASLRGEDPERPPGLRKVTRTR